MASGPIDSSAVLSALKDFKDPETGRNITQMQQVRDIQSTGAGLSLTLELTTHSAPLWEDTKISLEQLLRSHFPQAKTVTVNLVEHARPPQKLGSIGLASKSVIAVGSGKGGVGKSTIAASLALALIAHGQQSRFARCRRLWSEHSASAWPARPTRTGRRK